MLYCVLVFYLLWNIFFSSSRSLVDPVVSFYYAAPVDPVMSMRPDWGHVEGEKKCPRDGVRAGDRVEHYALTDSDQLVRQPRGIFMCVCVYEQ